MMDPTTCLAEARAMAERGDFEDALMRYEDLDKWLTTGGFLPTPWMRAYL